jgi:hypothetical protein
MLISVFPDRACDSLPMLHGRRASDDDIPGKGDWEGDAMMTKELHQKRAELSAQLPGLTLRRDRVFQLKCDAEKLDRFGVTHHTATESARLAEDHAAAEVAVRDLQLQLRDIDNEIKNAPGGSITTTIGRVLRRH